MIAIAAVLTPMRLGGGRELFLFARGYRDRRLAGSGAPPLRATSRPVRGAGQTDTNGSVDSDRLCPEQVPHADGLP
ncbi:MAG: hypothetical protein P0Y66_12435 [Candidatus Kaistia colombiensis]|nr:MAG: hypothetical protein P0Y66_12435 [Kaistia sp.]